MKYCTQCGHSKTEYVNQMVHTPKGPVPRSGKVLQCMNKDYFHPVEEEPMPCALVREDERFCGFEARGFTQKPEPPKLEVVKG